MEVKSFARDKYGAKFPMFEKTEVNGQNANEVYKFLRLHSELYSQEKKVVSEIPWNFAKFLVDQKGQVRAYFNPRTDPLSIIPDIKKIIDEWLNGVLMNYGPINKSWYLLKN